MHRLALALLCGSLAAATLSNGKLTAEFDERGLARVAGYRFTADNFAVTIDGHVFDSATLPRASSKADPNRILFTYRSTPYMFEVVYELRPDWHFISKQVIVSAPAGTKFRIDELQVFHSAIAEPIHDVY